MLINAALGRDVGGFDAVNVSNCLYTVYVFALFDSGAGRLCAVLLAGVAPAQIDAKRRWLGNCQPPDIDITDSSPSLASSLFVSTHSPLYCCSIQ